ncbi:phage major capsid protein [Sphingobium sp. AS12]|uniref:phage major capsid protein n=3 Tax=Sphingomonadaceae TaxID=41297 RepID=UPI001C311C89|nr:phage major capsid protein [Sphingobium sp. AS12]MBV2148534.1 phage major capsid protein [Sphingobium sp. AS12]
MSEIEELLRRHTDSVDAALSGFEGQITTINDAVQALQRSQSQQPIRTAVARGGSISRPGHQQAGSVDGIAPSSFGMADMRNLSCSGDARDSLANIMRGVVTSAMRENSDPDGGYLVPEVIAAQIETLVLRQSPLRRICRVVDFISSPKVVLPVNARGATAGWVGETEDRTETETPELATVNPPGGTLYALPAASEEVVEDAIINMDQFLEENVVDAFAESESEAFIRGNGIKKPAGFLAPDRIPTTQADGARPVGTLQYIPTGNPASLSTDMISLLVKMIFSMKAGYRQAPGVAWLAATEMISYLTQLRDELGRPLFIPSLTDGVPGTLLGYPVLEAEHMDPVVADATPLAFGNWQRGYVIGDRTKLNVLRDPYTTKGIIKWYFRKRVHGSVLNSEAIKLLRVSAE